MPSNRSVLTHAFIKEKQKVNTEVNRANIQTTLDRVILSTKRYQVYHHLIKNHMCQSQVAKKLKISRPAVQKHVKALEALGVIEPIKQKANPKFYKSTNIIPATIWTDGKKKNAILNKEAKKPQRRVGKPYKTVRDHKTGRFKGSKKPRGEGVHREFSTLISQDGRRVNLLRLHSISYSCKVLSEPDRVPWKKVGSPKGLEQYVYKHVFTTECEIDKLKELEVTFVRKKSVKGDYDEIVIYMPEKYLLEFELDTAKAILEEYVWVARKWFQNRFKVSLGMPFEYRNLEVAREIVEPELKRVVDEHGMVKIKTGYGYALIDESKKGYPEKEFSSIEAVKAELAMPFRVLQLEDVVKVLAESVAKVADAQAKIFELLSDGKMRDREKEFENIERGSIQ